MNSMHAAPGWIEGGVGGTARKVLFLDRDGVINVNLGYVHTPEGTQWVPGIFELCAAAQAEGYALVVATNQAGIARGYYDITEFERYTKWMHAQFAERGITIRATVYCPHHPEMGVGSLRAVCQCRKPAPGMFIEAFARLSVDPGQSLFVGDKVSDMQAGAAAGLGRLFLIAGDVGEGDAPHHAIIVPDLDTVRTRL